MIAATMLSMANHPAPPLAVKESDLEVLRALVRARTTEQRLVQRARIVLHAAQGTPNRTIAAAVGVAPMTVLLWRTKYARDGLAGLADEPRPGRPPTYSREDRDRVIAMTLEPPSDGTTHWSAQRLGKRLGMSETTVWRIWQSVGLKPHRTETFKFSTDPELEAKIRDVVGLYLAPPERAIVLSVDEKTQIPALDRTQPMLPLREGSVERRTHDYVRNGTTSIPLASHLRRRAVPVAVVNPLAAKYFAKSRLARTKSDPADARTSPRWPGATRHLPVARSRGWTYARQPLRDDLGDRAGEDLPAAHPLGRARFPGARQAVRRSHLPDGA